MELGRKRIYVTGSSLSSKIRIDAGDDEARLALDWCAGIMLIFAIRFCVNAAALEFCLTATAHPPSYGAKALCCCTNTVPF
jgi:hypothetical protein